MDRLFPAKVLLFGEHRVLRGAKALAVPYTKRGVEWRKHAGEIDNRLLAFANYLTDHFSDKELKLESLKSDLEQGWQLSGNVPFGYGLGSSGTVCAAIWARYATTFSAAYSLGELREKLALMEAYFHGSSSGTDPLISLLDRPALLQGGQIGPLSLPEKWSRNFFLLDTKIPRKSGPLIQQFLLRYDQDKDWRLGVNEYWGKADEACIEALVAGEETVLKTAFYTLSMYQSVLARDLIPSSVQSIWRGESYRLKICGAGGGGFMLGYSTDQKTTRQELNNWDLFYF